MDLNQPFLKPDDVMEVLRAMKFKIRVQQTPEGNLLEWDVSSKPNTPQAADTSFLKPSVSLSE
jgi:hypothetical protein